MNCKNAELEALSNCPEYTPLQRPTKESEGTAPVACELSEGEIEDDDDENVLDKLRSSSDDSDCEIPLKRHKPAVKLVKNNPSQNFNKEKRPQKKYNIWSSSLQEQTVLDEFSKCDVQNIDWSRSVESYYISERQPSEPEGEMPEEEIETEKTEENMRIIASELLESVPCNSRKRKVKDRCRKNFTKYETTYYDDDSEIVPRYLLDLAKTAEDSEEELAQDIANKLFETKEELVTRVVETIGKEKAIEIFNETKKIEEEGGMQIKNQTRKRTPGGVYFFLVKMNCSLDENKSIFTEDKGLETRKRKKLKAKQWRDKEKKRTQNAVNPSMLSDNLHKELPNLLTADLISKRLSPEETDVPSPPPSPVSVSLNPPPSPATDENPSLASNSRTLSVYNDDLFDINYDEMELS